MKTTPIPAHSEADQVPQIVVLDDEEEILASMKFLLRSHGMGPITTLSDGRELLPLLDRTPTAVLLMDLRMPGISGLELLQQVQTTHPAIPVVIVTAVQEVDTAVECMKKGAADYLLKPVNVGNLIATVRKALELYELRQHASALKDYLLGGQLKSPEAFDQIVTRSHKMQSIFKYMESSARTGEPMLIIGETGTGKELLAQAFHLLRKKTGPLVPVNVAGLDDHMFADTLFGHVKGAFTGAMNAREGLVAKAARGTLFLDEIGDLSESSQIKLLRLLQEKKYEPIGSDISRNADVTIVAATNRDLKQRIREGKFRSDLYFRLATHAVTIPPLRERKEDIPLLLAKFIQDAAQAIGVSQTPVITRQLIQLLECHDFPGNIRELRALSMDAMAHYKSGPLGMETFRKALTPNRSGGTLATRNDSSESGCPAAPLSWPEGHNPPTLKEAEEYLIAHAIDKSQGNQGIAAMMLGLSRQALNQRLARKTNKPVRS
ncbi:MAG: sigma-54-dependent Fis family transcriptional regulator [Magnetococcales bacterium]|nr:sigma-54-dependent Fis family transcriptional regulator [Magnetococcales bacterium]